MAGINKVTLIGHLGRDPEIRNFQNGGRVASFSVATSESWKDKKTGERKEKTEWHRVAVLSEGLVGIVEKYLKKGGRVYIEGRLETREYSDKDGVKRYTTEIVLRGYGAVLQMLDGPRAAVPTTAAAEPPAPPVLVQDDLVPDEIPY
jgi:single-strand DNA-binding protein